MYVYKRLFILVLLGLIIFISGCNQNLTIDQSELVAIVGDSLTLEVQGAKPDQLDWSSSDTTVATVDQQGKVIAVGPGSAVITVTAGEETAVCNIAVSEPDYVIQLIPDTISLEPSTTAQIQLEMEPVTGYETILWESDSTSIANVDQTGKVTGVAPGLATVSVSVGSKKASCQISVFGITPRSLVLKKGETRQLQFAPLSEGESVVWTSSEPDVVSIDQTGNVSAVGQGEASITARMGDKYYTCQVRVQPPDLLQNVKELAIMVDADTPSISPDGSMYVTRSLGMWVATATLSDFEGNDYPLPGSGASPASWRGKRLVYHNLEIRPDDEGNVSTVLEDAIYLYNTQGRTYTKIPVQLFDSPTRGQPVLSDENTISVIFHNGLWRYDLDQQSWTHASEFQAEIMGNWDWPAIVWSPDYSKAVWLEGSRDSEFISMTLLDTETGSRKVIYQQHNIELTPEAIMSKLQPIIHIAWADDGRKLAVTGGSEDNILILTSEGEVMETLEKDDYISSLTWVPGQDKITYAAINSFFVMDITKDKVWESDADIFHHTWLEDGHLASLSETKIIIYEIDWQQLK